MPRRKYDGPNRFGTLSPSGEHGRKLYVRIAESISDTLMAGRYARGERLPAERDLAQHFGVSRPTIREALLALEVQGLLELRKSTGITVTLNGPRDTFVPDSDAGALQLLQSRRLFEGEVAALAALNATDRSIAELAQAMHRLNQGGEDDVAAPFRDFHILVARICANNVTIACIANLWSPHRGDPHLYMLLNLAARLGEDAWRKSHKPLFETIAARDPHAARSAMNVVSDQAIVHLRHAVKRMALENRAMVTTGNERPLNGRSSMGAAL